MERLSSLSISRITAMFYRSLLSTPLRHHHHPLSDADDALTTAPSPLPERTFYDRPLKNGLHPYIYRAIFVGKAEQKPLHKKLRSGTVVTLLSIGTGGIPNNRRPLDHKNPREYANQCVVQWHRVTIYLERLGNLLMKHVLPSSTLYVEGNLETKVFFDPIVDLVSRILEVVACRNGHNDDDADQQPNQNDLRAIGYC